MTERLYWTKPKGKEFTATVVKVVQPRKKDYGPGLVLDRTLFYPEGGGQPCDQGCLRLGGYTTCGDREPANSTPHCALFEGVELAVTRVEDEGEGILHWLAAGVNLATIPLGACVRGTIDWERRFDHMQQHTGQHVLSWAFLRELEVPTTGFHLSADYASIDLAVSTLTDLEVRRVEDLANRVVFANVPIEAHEYLPDELPGEVRRRILKATGKVRVVHIGHFDACACGGTHLATTGEIGLIKINEVTRAKAHGGTRVIFRCGWRALRDYTVKERTLLQAARDLARPYTEVAHGVSALLVKVEEAEKETKELRAALLEQEAKLLAREVDANNPLVRELPGRSMDELRQLAKAVATMSGSTIVLFALEPRFSVTIAAGNKVVFDCRAAAAKIGELLGLRGGGTSNIAQIGSRDPWRGDSAIVAARIREVLESVSHA
jgi:alanyl-tRNA synthetase